MSQTHIKDIEVKTRAMAVYAKIDSQVNLFGLIKFQLENITLFVSRPKKIFEKIWYKI